MVMKRRRRRLCVHKSVWAWVQKLFAGSLFQVELASSKSQARSPPWFFLGSSRSTSFSTRFLVPKALSLARTFRQLSSSPAGYFPSNFAEKTPYDIPYALFDATRNDSACTYPHSCFPVIYLLSIRHPSYCHSHPSPSSLEQTGGSSKRSQFHSSPTVWLLTWCAGRVWSPELQEVGAG